MEYWVLDNFGEKRELTWEQVAEVEKDLCYLLHNIVDDYRNLGGSWEWDWYSERIFPQKYWEFLGICGCESTQQRDFINNGCLLWVLGLSMEQIEDFDTTSLARYGDEIATRLSAFQPEGEVTTRLLHITQYFFNVARSLPSRTGIGRPVDHVQIDPDMLQQLNWVFSTIVEGYYRYMLNLIAGDEVF